MTKVLTEAQIAEIEARAVERITYSPDCNQGVVLTAWKQADADRAKLLASHRALERELAEARAARLAAEADAAALRDALEYIAEEHDAGRYDGKPEPCPAHDDVTMWAVARDALTTHGERGRKMLARMGKLETLLKRYRKETPLGHQPHMIAHLVDEILDAKEPKP